MTDVSSKVQSMSPEDASSPGSYFKPNGLSYKSPAGFNGL